MLSGPSSSCKCRVAGGDRWRAVIDILLSFSARWSRCCTQYSDTRTPGGFLATDQAPLVQCGIDFFSSDNRRLSWRAWQLSDLKAILLELLYYFTPRYPAFHHGDYGARAGVRNLNT